MKRFQELTQKTAVADTDTVAIQETSDGVYKYATVLDVVGDVLAGGGVTAASALVSGTTIGNLTLADGSITDSSGAISFGNENLTTTGNINALQIITSGGITSSASAGEAVYSSAASAGAVIRGNGSTNDFQLQNSSNANVMVVPTGTTSVSFAGNTTTDGKVSWSAPSELTIATGAVTCTESNHAIDTESDAATDDLDTINGGVDGALLTIRPADDARTVVAKDATGNLHLAGDFSMDIRADRLTLIYDATTGVWHELCRSNNG